jgi:hypothetical protein
MTTLRQWISALLLAGVCLPAGAQHILQDLTSDERKALGDFGKRADAYMRMERGLPAEKPKPTADVAQIDARRKNLREAVQQARTGARQGDVFTPEAAAAFRDIFKRLLAGQEGQKIRASLHHAEPGAPADLKVNAVYPNTKGEPVQSVPAGILSELPPLPKGLEYRIAGNMLALRDRDANLVVDYLPDALPGVEGH